MGRYRPLSRWRAKLRYEFDNTLSRGIIGHAQHEVPAEVLEQLSSGLGGRDQPREGLQRSFEPRLAQDIGRRVRDVARRFGAVHRIRRGPHRCRPATGLVGEPDGNDRR